MHSTHSAVHTIYRGPIACYIIMYVSMLLVYQCVTYITSMIQCNVRIAQLFGLQQFANLELCD